MPPRGSLQDRILQETIERERYADYRKHLFLERSFVFAVRGVESTVFGTLEEELALAIFQTAFDPEAVQERLASVQAAMKERKEVLLRDARMLARVASYSETGEDQEDHAQQEDVFARRLAERAARKDV